MLTTESILDLLKNNREYLAREFGVSKIGLFGSCAVNEKNEKERKGARVELNLALPKERKGARVELNLALPNTL